MDFLNFSANERVDLADLNYVTQDTPLGLVRELAANFALNPKATQLAYIINGFAATNPTGNQIQVTLGSAFLGRRVGLSVSYGLLTATGDATQSIDTSNFQAGTYGVYVKFDQTAGGYENRTFWQSGDAPGEYAQNVPTKLQSTWQMTIVALTPGPEWLQVASLTLPGNTLTDTRPLYFEGRPDQAYTSNWGAGTNDRSSNRAAYGVGDLQTFTAAMRTAIEDVKGPGLTRWWENKIGGQNIGFAGTPTLGRTAWADTNFFAQGSATAPALTFDANSSLLYTRATHTFAFTPNATTSLLVSPTAATAPLNLVVGNANQLTFQATPTTASALWAPASTSALFEQRATNAALSTLSTYAGGTLAGSVDSNRNWLLGSASTAYAYPVSGTATSYAALTVADTTGNPLLRLDSSAASGVAAILSLRANTAPTSIRFTANATSTAATYLYALGSSGTIFSLATAAGTNVFSYDSTVGLLNMTGSTPYANTYTTPVKAYTAQPSIYQFYGAGGALIGGGGVIYNPANGNIAWPIILPDNATLISVTLNMMRQHSGSSTASNNVTISLVANAGSGLSNVTTGPSIIASNTYAPGWQPNTTPTASLAQYNVALSNFSATASTNLYNFVVMFSDTDTAVLSTIFRINITYTRPDIMGGNR